MKRLWKKKQSAKIRLAASHASAIQKAIKESVDVSLLVTDFFFAHNLAPISTSEARTWVKLHVRAKEEDLNKALTQLYAESYVMGGDIGLSALAKAAINKSAPSLREMQSAMGINWADWKAGNRAAAALVKPKGGLKQILNDRGKTIKGINATTYDRIGTQLAYALQRGLSPSSVAPEIAQILGRPSPERTAYLIQQGYEQVDAMLSDPERALTIAQTEMSRAVTIAARELYVESGVELVSWLTADPCDICQENEDVSPIPIEDSFPSGDTEPPAHPNCVCDLSPYVVDTQNIGEDALALTLDQ